MPLDKPVTFGGFRFDAANEQLWRGAASIALRPKAFAVLRYLVDHQGRLITKQQLLDAVWPGTFVSDAVLKDCISQVREALGDDPARPRFIETAHRRGYRFIGQISEDTSGPPLRPKGADATGDRAGRTHSTTTVLGREGELATMSRWLHDALRGERQIVFVTGEPGIGKTTLVNAVRDEAAASGFWIAGGQCLEQYGASEAYLPVLDSLSRLGRAHDRERIVALLRAHAPTWLVELPSLLSAEERDRLREQKGGASREPLLRELADAIETITAEAPLVIVLEDLHWSDYSTLDLISHLARRPDPARLMVIGTYRPVDVSLGDHPLRAVKRELQAHGLCRELPLQYLTEEAVAGYLAARLPGHQLPAWLRRLVHRRTEGNPLFMVNLVDYLVAEGIVVAHGGGWRLQGEFADIESGIPENIRQLIEKQIDRLSQDERRVLDGASVVGLECSTTAIAAGLEQTNESVDEHCEGLVRHQFLLPARLVELPDGTVTARYTFSHILYLDVPYRAIPAMRRAQIHRRIGHAGEAIYRDRVWEIAAELAMHFEQGKDAARAVRYLLLAARNAQQRSAHHEAEALARRGLAAVDALPPSEERDQYELDLRLVLGASVMALKGFAADEVKDIYVRVVELCGGRNASYEAFAAQWRLLIFDYFRGEIQRSHDLARQLVDHAERLGDALSHTRAQSGLGAILVERGEFGEALRLLDAVASVADSQRDRPSRGFAGRDPTVTCECLAARALWTLGYPDRAMMRVAGTRARVDARPHAETQVFAMYVAAHLHELRGEASAAQHEAESVIALADDYGLSAWVALARVTRGWARAAQGAAEEGIAELQHGLSAYQQTGARLWRVYGLGLLAQTLASLGRYDDALAAIEEALSLVQETGEHGSSAELHRIEGDLHFARATHHGDRSLVRAEQSLMRALDIAGAQHAKSWQLRATTSLARVYGLQGRLGEATQLLTPLIDWFTEGHETGDLKAARVVLRELSPSGS